ncbi:MAG: outer membrane beta-barrel protein [Pseudolabrys sp.]
MTGPLGVSETKTKLGYALGAGVEYAFMGPWSAKLEYLYTDLGTSSCGTCVPAGATDVKFKANVVKLGVNYRF